jgi:hypothetical protein
MRASLVLLVLGFAAVGCGPSPAMPARVAMQPANTVVVYVDSDDLDEEDAAPAPERKPVEYVRMDEWVPPPSVAELEARIEPRGDRPPDYIRLPKLMLHRGISPSTTFRRGHW